MDDLTGKANEGKVRELAKEWYELWQDNSDIMPDNYLGFRARHGLRLSDAEKKEFFGLLRSQYQLHF